MTDNTSFVQTESTTTASGSTEQGNFSQQDDQSKGKSIEEQLAMVQKRLNDKEAFIQTLQGENKTNLDKISEFEQMGDLSSKIDELLARKDTSQQDEYTGTQNQGDTFNDLKSQGFITKQDLEDQKTEARKAENFNKVKSALVDSYGEDKYFDSLQTKASELGMNMEDVDRLVHSNPTAAIKLFGQEKTSTTSNSSGTINTQAFDKNNTANLTAPKSVMYGASTKDVVANWMAAGEIANQKA